MGSFEYSKELEYRKLHKELSNEQLRYLFFDEIGICVAGVWVIMYHPDYDQQRQKIFETYATAMEYLPVQLLEPTRQTVQVLWEMAPGQKFFLDVIQVLKNFLIATPGVLINWFSLLLQAFISQIKAVLTQAIAEWWKNVKVW